MKKHGAVIPPGTLIFFCGKMGAGKSTVAKAMAEQNNAVLLVEDHWLAAHYPDQLQTFEDYIVFSKRIRPFIKSHVQSILKLGMNVVMDFPANTAKQRHWFKELGAEIGADLELIFLDVSDEQCLARLELRRKEQPERAQFDTPDVFAMVTRYFEIPDEKEGITMISRT